MRVAALAAGFVAWVGAALASLCCLLPLAVIVLGLGSGAFMATTMQYRWLLIPAGIIGIVTGVGLRLATRPAGWCADSIRRAIEGRPRSGRDDLRCLPRWGEEGPGRAEGSESGRCEPQGEGSGRDVRPCRRHGLADDRGRRSSRITRDTQEFAAFSTADDALKRT